MKTDHIKEIKIDESGRLCIFPEKERFSMIWRSATEVHWDDKGLFLFSPKPREWSYFDWYKHIIKVVQEANCHLVITDKTVWIDIPPTLKEEIESFCNLI
ncbi:hypothetical protein [Mucilaginibacter gotjawali]|uniref:Uncharacterized protein n=2 Tax=Mucilaginibacter gotjawali TaxID=1550579 RepID=A0A0X8X2X9_9SPHI|nr:hypothetical protein [Mucilaginibacter gotjawali]MBB3055911.1 hypothetical protein [Mucilaginibacter gotjawali]BAU54734.1 hypothetical protein MgSA37_02912 [Mucilaginibacter gotjawali]